MDNIDKLYNQIKTAAENAETKDFPSMDKVWNRVEEKLDKKVLTKQNTLWKKIAVAASVLLVVSIAYQYFKEEKPLVLPQNKTVSIDTTKLIITDSLLNKNSVASSAEYHMSIEEKPNGCLSPIQEGATRSFTDSISTYQVNVGDAKIESSGSYSTKSAEKSSVSSNSSNGWYANPKFDSRGVKYEEAEEITTTKETQKLAKKEAPIVVMDDLESDSQKLSNLNADEIESIIELKDPLYIINGVYYTEQEVFGPNPTSPYTPLNNQKIETISILQDEKAISIYGEKGKKGVVIITTKDGKPTPK
jgi:TonB-dependent SusC/RagA subfamily outer membrane receptor